MGGMNDHNYIDYTPQLLIYKPKEVAKYFQKSKEQLSKVSEGSELPSLSNLNQKFKSKNSEMNSQSNIFQRKGTILQFSRNQIELNSDKSGDDENDFSEDDALAMIRERKGELNLNSDEQFVDFVSFQPLPSRLHDFMKKNNAGKYNTSRTEPY